MGEVTRFAGYAAVWDRVDRAGDVVRRGAFAGVGPVPLLWQHAGVPVGALDAIEEDGRGLRVAGRIAAADAAALVRAGRVAGLSVGYRPLAARQGARRELLRVELLEVSLVPVPMQPGARIDRVWTEEE